MSKSNLCIVGLTKHFTNVVCNKLAISMDMYYANLEEIFVYELTDFNQIEELCGIEYLQKEERSIVRRICSYDNTLVNIKYALLNLDGVLDIVHNNCLLVYVALNKESFETAIDNEETSENARFIEKEAFDDRDFLCRRMSDLTIECNSLDEDECVEAITRGILNYYN